MLDTITVIDRPLRLGTGLLLGLTEKQAALRSHALKPAESGQWLTVAPVEFKMGERIRMRLADVPKGSHIGSDAALPQPAPRKRKAA